MKLQLMKHHAGKTDGDGVTARQRSHGEERDEL